MVREVVAQLAALLMAEVCEEGVRDDMVGGAKVVNALIALVLAPWERQDVAG